MAPFPLVLLTWRECVVGFQPTEMVHMQVEKNWTYVAPKGFGFDRNGEAMGVNLGFVKWAMRDAVYEGQRLRVLHSEAYELKTGEYRIEEAFVDPATNRLVLQNEQRTTRKGVERSEATFRDDVVEIRRTLPSGKVLTARMVPADGMAAVQRRFAPVAGDAPKEFLQVDGIRGTFVKVRVELAGRFRGNWGADKYEGNAYRFEIDGKPQVAMLDEASELVKVAFTDAISLALTSQPKSKRYEDNLPGAKRIDPAPAKALPTKRSTGAGT